MASACLSFAILMISSPSVYAVLLEPGSSTASSASETCKEVASAGVYIEMVLIPSFFAVLMVRTAIWQLASSRKLRVQHRPTSPRFAIKSVFNFSMLSSAPRDNVAVA